MSPLPNPTRTLTSILVECGIITDAEVEQALARQRETGLLIGETLVELGFTTEENIGWALSKQLGVPYADVQTNSIDEEQVRRFPEPLLRRIQAVPLFGTEEEVTVAMADPTDVEAVRELEAAMDISIALVIGGPGSIRRALDHVYGTPRATTAPGGVLPAGRTRGNALPTSRRDVVWDRAGTNFLLYHLHAAIKARASEVHFVPAHEELTVAYRTDEGLVPQPSETIETSLYLRARLSVLGVPDLEDGDDQRSTWGATVTDVAGTRVRLAACHTRVDTGIVTVLRVGPAPDAAPDLETLGLSPVGEAEIRDFVDGPEGLVIVTGPPRAGGSILLASLASLASRPSRRTLVLEPAPTCPYPPDSIRVRVGTGSAVLGSWERLAVGLGADVVVLEDVLSGREIEGVLRGATVGRLVFARTDWLDPDTLLAFLAKSRNGRAVLRDRPFALVSLPPARQEGASVWADPDASARDQGIVPVNVLTDEERDALFHGGNR
ncbi:MAG: ATPase, T2SS/T4P/T4SS family [Hyphomicrobiales bacterium]